MAIIISALSFIGYLTIKIFGHKKGIFLTGAAGGFISSTATTVSLSKMYKEQPFNPSTYASGIGAACSFMFLRVIAIVYITNPSLTYQLLPAYAATFIGGLLISYYFFKTSSAPNINFEKLPLSKNPLQLSEAIKFAFILGVIFGAVKFTAQHYGNSGVYFMSFISGIADVDAISLSLSEMTKDNNIQAQVSIYGISIAAVVNSIVKLIISYWIGGKPLGHKMAVFFSVTIFILMAGLSLSLFF